MKIGESIIHYDMPTECMSYLTDFLRRKLKKKFQSSSIELYDIKAHLFNFFLFVQPNEIQFYVFLFSNSDDATKLK